VNELPKDYPEPTQCDLCGNKIHDDEIYYIGVTRAIGVIGFGIWTNTCSKFKCYKWLTHKLKFKRPWKEPKK
jgi:hypothetical protein